MTSDTERQIDALLAQMTLVEKIAMLHGATPFDVEGCERLGVPQMRLSDGPMGCKGPHFGPTLAVPQSSAMAATFDESQVFALGVALGEESNDSGVDMLLGPTVNLHRSPLGGRHFECMSEDPYLTAQMAVAYIRGLQSTGVAACVKHLVCNDQEHERMTIDVHVDERTLREVYLRPFEAAITVAGSKAIMTSYNFVNGHHASAQPHVLDDILKGEWGFDGVVVSDWSSLKETDAPALHGLDLEMPGPGEYWGSGKLQAAVEAGRVPEASIDDKVRRLLRLLAWRGRLQGTRPPDPNRSERAERSALVRRVAADAMVLMRNDGVLPLRPGATVAVIGGNGEFTEHGGGGSGDTVPYRRTSVLEALRERWVGEVTSAMGIDIRRRLPTLPFEWLRGPVKMEVFAGTACDGTPVAVEERLAVYNVLHASSYVAEGSISVRLSFTMVPDESGRVLTMAAALGVATVTIDGMPAGTNEVDDFYAGTGLRGGNGEVVVEAGREYRVVLEACSADHGARYLLTDFGVRFARGGREQMLREAEEAASSAEVAVVVVGSTAEWESEGGDRADLHLPVGQDELVRRVRAVNPRTVVVLNCGAPMEMPWYHDVSAVLLSWYAGQDVGASIVDVLVGDAEPGGRMPTTWAKHLRDTPSFLHYPGEAGVERYGEELWVGHRWYDARGIEPLVPFGHGGSYTTFSWGDAIVGGSGVDVVVEVPVTNTGDRAGCDVVQLYVESHCSPVPRPVRHLAGFCKVRLGAGETSVARIGLDRRSFSRWDLAARTWVVDPGEYHLVVAASAVDLRQHLAHTL